jgi:hypothetical protein
MRLSEIKKGPHPAKETAPETQNLFALINNPEADDWRNRLSNKGIFNYFVRPKSHIRIIFGNRRPLATCITT